MGSASIFNSALLQALVLAVYSLKPEPSVFYKCLDHSKDKLMELENVTVNEDVHDKILGKYTEVWGPKVIFDADNTTCIKFKRTKVNETVLARDMYARSKWFGGEKVMPMTLEKIYNGVYLMRKEGVAKSMLYILFANNNVLAHYSCMITPRSDPQRPYLAFKSAVIVKDEVLKRPMESSVQEAVDQAVSKIQEAQDLLGEITQYNYPC